MQRQRTRKSGWATAIRWVLVLAVVVALVKYWPHLNAQQVRAWMPGGVGLDLEVVSLDCGKNNDSPFANVAVRNTGDTTIEGPKGVVDFDGARHPGTFSPAVLKPGQTGTMTVYAFGGESSDCAVVELSDREGRSMRLRGLHKPLQ